MVDTGIGSFTILGLTLFRLLGGLKLLFAQGSTDSSLLLDLLLVGFVVGFEIANLAHAVGVDWFVGVRARSGLLELVPSMVTSVAHVSRHLILVVMRTLHLLTRTCGVHLGHVLMASFYNIIAERRIWVFLQQHLYKTKHFLITILVKLVLFFQGIGIRSMGIDFVG